MKMNDIRDIQIKIRKKYSPQELQPEILMDIVHILFEYLDNENNQPERLSEKNDSAYLNQEAGL